MLAALEAVLRTEVADVERRSNRITVLGLGPGPTRRVNRRDMTVIYVIDDDGTTVIDADVSYQASAFLGNVSQDEVMRERLMEIFAQMRELLASTPPTPPQERQPMSSQEAVAMDQPVVSHEPAIADRVAAHPESIASEQLASPPESVIPGKGEVVAEEPPHFASAAEPVEKQETRIADPTAAPSVPEPAPQTLEAAAEAAGDPVSAVPEPVVIDENAPPDWVVPAAKESKIKPVEWKLEPVPEPVVTNMPAPVEASVADIPKTHAKDEAVAAIKEAPPTDAETTLAEEPISVEEEDDTETSGTQRWWIVLAVLAACLAAALPFGMHYLSSRNGGQQNQQQADHKSAPSAASEQQAAVAKPEDLLRQWEESMRTTDADTQASYYTDPAEHYMWRVNATRAQIAADKKAEIAKRHGEWTFAIEQLQIDQQGDAATVNLVKHYTEKQPDRPQRQWYVPAELKLKYQYGIWWITSERDLSQPK